MDQELTKIGVIRECTKDVWTFLDKYLTYASRYWETETRDEKISEITKLFKDTLSTTHTRSTSHSRNILLRGARKRRRFNSV